MKRAPYFPWHNGIFFRYTKSVKIQCIINHKKGRSWPTGYCIKRMQIDNPLAKECIFTMQPTDQVTNERTAARWSPSRRHCFFLTTTSHQMGQTSLQRHRGKSCNLRSRRDKSFKLRISQSCLEIETGMKKVTKCLNHRLYLLVVNSKKWQSLSQVTVISQVASLP